MTKKILAASAFVSVLLLGVYGCNSPESELPTSPIPVVETQDVDDHSDHDHADHDRSAQKTDMQKMTENLASFLAEDRDSAMKQHFCPVSDEMLGSMGVPEKLDVNGQSVWICCDGCKDKLLADPEQYLAKLPE